MRKLNGRFLGILGVSAFALALAVLAIGLGLWWSRGSTPDPLVLSREAFERGQIGKALSLASEAVQSRPGDARAREMKEKVLARLTQSSRLAPAKPPSEKAAARAALAAGRADQAISELRSILAQGPDREASWLLSRAFLQKRDVAAARSAIQDSARFGTDDPTIPEPAPYVGASRCQPCHEQKYRTQRASGHGQSLASGPDVALIPFPDARFQDPDSPRVSYAFHQEGTSVTLDSQIGGTSYPGTVTYAVGSGTHGLSVVVEDEQARARLARVSLFLHKTKLDLTASVPRGVFDDRQYLGRPLDQVALGACLSCHTTALIRSGPHGGFTQLERGIGCERCHGPGDHHIKAVEANLDDLAIARFRRASPQRTFKLCAQCHMPLPNDPLSPGDPALVRQQALTLPMSRCFTSSGGALSCVTCHDPHQDAETNHAHYERICLDCHSSTEKRGAPMPAGASAEGRRASVCPVNAARDCIACHMAKVEIPDEHASYTDHHIRIHRAAAGPGGG